MKHDLFKGLFKSTLLWVVFFTFFSVSSGFANEKTLRGNVKDKNGDALPGVTVLVKDTPIGTVTDLSGNFTLRVSGNAEILQISFIGLKSQEVIIGNRTNFQIVLEDEAIGIDEVVVVGYGVQRRSDITGSVASLSADRLSSLPNTNLAQAIQGSIPGVSILTSSAGANPSQSILIRGRNSIRASNEPLIVLDGVPFEGIMNDINPNDIKSIEILKDASSAAIYGSRGSNGVILITTKSGDSATPKIAYNGYYSFQSFTKIPDYLTPEEFYAWKNERNPGAMTPSEQNIYDNKSWVDWIDLALRQGKSTEHNLSVSGNLKNTRYYLSGGITDVQGLAVNNNYKRVTTRLNIESNVRDWITLGARVNLSYQDKSGLSPTWGGDHGVFGFNPLTRAYDDDGNLTIYPWPEDPYLRNPLMGSLANSVDEEYSGVLNNYLIVKFPFVKGLEYRLNTGITARFRDIANYFGRNTTSGFEDQGSGWNNRTRQHKTVLENILSYNRTFGKHNVFLTGLYSFENYMSSSNRLSTKGYPNDFLLWYAGGQAQLIDPSYLFTESTMISQMLRVNYGYDSRYLLTLTARRDGYSGFGADNKWGIFPSAALAWNVANEKFFPFDNFMNEFKLRLSYGKNGNQAINPYETISRLSELNMVAGSTTFPGFFPSVLGSDNLTWESTATLNLGLDYGFLNNRISGDINVYKSNTTDLLLNRTIPGTHGITSIVQNIGETENRGVEFSIITRNISTPDFQWRTNANFSLVQNKILRLYGMYNIDGVEIDDVNNSWFIGQPIRVNYGYVWGGVWQLGEEEEAAKFGTQPGFLKVKDVNGDGIINADDRQIQGNLDPNFLWGMTNTFTYKNLSLSIFIHGVHGMTKTDPLMTDGTLPEVRYNVTRKNWWTPENPTNDWYKNDFNAHRQGGFTAVKYLDASFIRIKDVVLSYNFPERYLKGVGFDNIKVFATGRNLYTFTKYTGLDPELSSQGQVPLQKEFVFGLNFGF